MAPIPPKPILFVGALTEDTIFKVPGFGRGPGKFLPDAVTRNAAGMASSAASAAARLGARAVLWASAGEDATGTELIAELSAEGIDCSHVRHVAGGRSARATIIVDDTGERWILVDYDPITQAAPDSLPDIRIADYAAVMCDVRWPGAARIALEAARTAGAMAILDADVAPQEVLAELAGCATHIIASEPGASILFGETLAPERAARMLSERYGVAACVTAGGQGTSWADGAGAPVRHVAAPRVRVVDTLAAGDVFHGALAVALAEGQGMEQSIRFASAAAALKCTVFGGRFGAPNRQDTEKLMQETYSG